MIAKVLLDKRDQSVVLTENEAPPRRNANLGPETSGVRREPIPPRPVEQQAQTKHKIAETREEIHEAFRLVYSNYLNKGLIEANPLKIRITPYHALECADVFISVAADSGKVIGTMSLIGDNGLGLPMEEVYPKEVRRLRNTGVRIAEVCSLAEKFVGKSFRDLMRLINLMSQRARYRGIDELLIAVHPRHAKFYSDFLSFEPFGPERVYAAVCDHPAVAMRLNLTHLHQRDPSSHRRMFGKPFPGCLLDAGPRSAALDQEIRWLAAETYASQKCQVA